MTSQAKSNLLVSNTICALQNLKCSSRSFLSQWLQGSLSLEAWASLGSARKMSLCCSTVSKRGNRTLVGWESRASGELKKAGDGWQYANKLLPAKSTCNSVCSQHVLMSNTLYEGLFKSFSCKISPPWWWQERRKCWYIRLRNKKRGCTETEGALLMKL